MNENLKSSSVAVTIGGLSYVPAPKETPREELRAAARATLLAYLTATGAGVDRHAQAELAARCLDHFR